MTQEELFKKLVAHCKEYGFVFPSSEIYDGLGAVYDYGQNGVELKNNIKRYWWDSMVKLHEKIAASSPTIFSLQLRRKSAAQLHKRRCRHIRCFQ